MQEEQADFIELPLSERAWTYIKDGDAEKLRIAALWGLEAWIRKEISDGEYGRMCMSISGKADGEAAHIRNEAFTINGRAELGKGIVEEDPARREEELQVRLDRARIDQENLTLLATEHRTRAFKIQRGLPLGQSIYPPKPESIQGTPPPTPQLTAA